MADESTYLAWSKTIEEIKFRAFAFTEGCGRSDCDACQHAEDDGNPPVWAVFMQPRPDHDEWCLSLIAYGTFAEEDGKAKLEDALRQTAFESGRPIEQWCKLAALVGLGWSAVVGDPFRVAAHQKEAADEFMSPSIIGGLFRAANEEQLRGIRADYDQGGAAFGRAVGRVWWELIKRHAAKHRGE